MSDKELSGRELDITMAERVMCWPRHDNDDDRDYSETYFSAYNDGGQIVVFHEGSQRKAERWSPTQSIEAAMQVVEKMQERGWESRIGTHSFGPRWMIEMYHTKDNLTRRESATSDSLPECISRCALAAIGSKPE